MAAQRSEDLRLDTDAITLALEALPPRLASNTVRPPGGKYRLEDRLNGAGTLGSIAPPPESALRAMSPTFPKRSSKHALWLASVLLVLCAATAAIVYRDMTRSTTASGSAPEAP